MPNKIGKFCPLIKKDCVGAKCAWYIQIMGQDPNTGQPVNDWACSIAWMPMLCIENSQQQRSTGAAVESFRNEVVKANEENRNLYLNNFANILPVNVSSLTNLNILEGNSNETDNSSD
jgi:hypothetical protein